MTRDAAAAQQHLGGLAPGLLAILAGYPTLGDPQTNAALDMLLSLLSDLGLEPPQGGIVSITQSVPELGPDGDADGDGASNSKEYNYFKSQGPAATIAAQLNPTQTPPNLAFISGGGLRMGQVVGQTNSKAEYPLHDPVTPQDLMATVYRHLGIDWTRTFEDFSGRPVPILFHGQPIRHLI